MSSSSSSSLSPNNREPFHMPPASPEETHDCYGYKRRPLRQLPENALDVINLLQKLVDEKEYELLCGRREREKIQEDARQQETYVMELEGEIIRFKEKIQIMEEKFRAKEMTWASDYQAFVAIINDLKAEGVRRYMEHLEYRCSLLLPLNPPEQHAHNGANAIDNHRE